MSGLTPEQKRAMSLPLSYERRMTGFLRAWYVSIFFLFIK